MTKQKNCDFSFSGLKAQIARFVQARGGVAGMDPQSVADLAASFQHTAVQHLHERTERALEWCAQNRSLAERPRSLVVCGYLDHLQPC